MAQEQVLAIDQGTQSVRAILFDLRGNLVAKSQVTLDPPIAAEPGWAEQHPTYYWHSLCRACRQLWQRPGVDKAALTGMALTGQRGTMVNLDRDGEPLRPAVVWLDRRRTRGLERVGGAWGLLFRLTGMAPTVAYFQAEAEANWLRTRQPELWAQTHKYLMLSGYLTYRLVGAFVDSAAAQVGYVPFDYKRLRWAAPWDWKWQAVPMDRSILPELVQPAAQLGQITASAAEATGIPAGLPLIAAAGDKACEALGAGCVSPEHACLSLGTSASVIVTQDEYRDVRPLIPPYPSAIPGAYNLEVQVYRGFWLVEWFKEQFGLPEQLRAHEQGLAPEDFFEDLVRSVPPGSQGLVLQPYWSPGLKVPGPEARGAIVGFSAEHTRAHLYRAMLEGLAFALREGMEQIERRTHTPVRELRVAGGGSRSDAAMQVMADVFGLPAARPQTAEASALGAAIAAAAGLGHYPDVPSATREMTGVGRVFEPEASTHAVYDRLYRDVYLEMYRRLRPLYMALRELDDAV